MFDTVESILIKVLSSSVPVHDNSVSLQYYLQNTRIRRTIKNIITFQNMCIFPGCMIR